jgi:Tol biopolymer transport system component/DNA-binding winged helix-turn-helix (wHTH) protein
VTVAPSTIRFGSFELDAQTGELRKGAERLKVPIQSIEILKALLERPGQLVTRDELRARLWPSDTFVDFEHGLNAAVRRLREALGDSADTPTYIETLPRRGYRFIGPMDGASQAIAAAAESIEVAAPDRRRRIPLSGVMLAVLAGVLAAAGVWMARITSGSTAPSAVAASLRTVPVTTFPGSELTPALSPDGKQVAFAWDGDGKQWDIYVKQLAGGDPVRVTTDPAPEFGPAWSPDGSRLAFLRLTGEVADAAVVIVPAFGGPERRVMMAETQIRATGVSWTPDGQGIVFAARRAPSTNMALFLYSLDTGQVQQLSMPAPDFNDGFPVISPDGQFLAFARRIAESTNGNVFVQHLDALRPVGPAQPLTSGNDSSRLDWMPDSRTIVFTRVARNGPPGLYTVSVAGGEPAALLTNLQAASPSVARDGRRVAYERVTTDMNIWRIAGPAQPADAKRVPSPERIIDSTSPDIHPQISPDGRRIAFVSQRSGTPEIWASKFDGSQQMQLTKFGGPWAGSPRWSADGNSIAFDFNGSGSWNIYVIASEGGRERAVTHGSSNNARPSWSHDGRWIYFASKRTGEWQVWKTSADGGVDTQITKRAGFEPFESPDGAYVYYAMQNKPGIWRVPVNGGDEVQVIDHGTGGGWAVADTGILLLNTASNDSPTFEFFDFAGRRLWRRQLDQPGLHLRSADPHVSISRDARWILYAQADHPGSDIEILEGLSVRTAPARAR